MSVESLKSFFDGATVVLLFLTFVAGAGVLFTGNVINKRQSLQLRDFEKSLTKAKTDLATQEERAAKAEGKIASADAASKEAVAKVAIAEARVAEASAKAESFRLNIAKAEESAAQAKAEAAQANLELAKLRTPRNLTPEQQERITAAIRPFPGTPYDLWVSTDSDSSALMNEIDSVLRAAKWEFHAAGIIQFGGKAGIISESGVSVHFPVELAAKLEQPALALAKALNAEGIPQKTVYADPKDLDKSFDRTRIHIWIGSKPLN